MNFSKRFAARALAALVVLSSFLLAPGSFSQVPQLLNYQGRVTVIGTNFNGTGQFKFALVNGNGTQTYWSNDGTSNAGSQPTASVSLPVLNGLYSVLLGNALLPNMTIVPVTVFTNPDVRLRVWFNDGSHGFQLLTPDQRIAAVGYAIMAGNVPDGSITGAKLAVGAVGAANIADGAITSTQLAAGAAAANLNAGGQSAVASGGVIMSTNPNATELLNAGYVRLTGIETAERFKPLHNAPPGDRYIHTAVWTGTEMIVWGGVNSNSTYLNDGARYNPTFDLWTPLSKINAPSERAGHTGVVAAGIMLIWGGTNASTPFGDGGYYNPASDEWTTIPANVNVPARAYHTAVVTGSNEMIVWGGLGAGGVPLNSGGRFNFTQFQSVTTLTNAPAVRYVHRAVWTGTEMIVWGGALSGSSFYNNGAHYNPTTNTWAAMSASPLGARYAHVMVWNGSRVLIWGGLGSAYFNDVASYNPGPKTWTTLSNVNAPSPRFYSTAVWSGSAMLVFGGQGAAGTPLGDGASFDPAANTWTTFATAAEPSGRYVHTAVWTGDEMIVWGGYGRINTSVSTLKDGGRFTPGAGGGTWKSLVAARGGSTTVWTGGELLIWGGGYGDLVYPGGLRLDLTTNSWRRIANDPAITPRFGHTAIWSGSQMIIWGGFNITYTPFTTYNYTNTGGRYNPATDTWSVTDASNAPTARSSHTAIWTGTEMIVWGGSNVTYAGDGGRYNPASDTWTPVPADPAVSARSSHKSVWTGSQMLVWGGFGTGFVYAAAGARYDPVNGVWTAMSAVNSPAPRIDFSLVWTGSEMIVWGGVAEIIFDYVGDGGRYNPTTDTWTAIPVSPLISRRGTHAAVWSGSEMIIWGGRSTPGGNNLGDGGRYDPAAAGGVGKWSAIAQSGVIGGRSDFSGAIWTGTEMLLNSPYASERGNYADVFSYTPPKTLYLYVRP